MRYRYLCAHCGKPTAGRKPRGGDGSLMYPRRHDDKRTGKPCYGNIIEAQSVEVEPDDKGRLRDLVGKRVRLLATHRNNAGEFYVDGDIMEVTQTWRGTFTLRPVEKDDPRRFGISGIPRRHVVPVNE